MPTFLSPSFSASASFAMCPYIEYYSDVIVSRPFQGILLLQLQAMLKDTIAWSRILTKTIATLGAIVEDDRLLIRMDRLNLSRLWRIVVIVASRLNIRWLSGC